MVANLRLEKRLNAVAYVVSAVVLLLVGLMRRIDKLDFGIDFSFLPPLHSALNALAAVFLLVALYHIRRGAVEKHRRSIYAALVCSGLFLLSYVVYHLTTEEIRFGDADHDGTVSAAELAAVGAWRTVYLVLLLTHVVLAGVILPFILLTFNRAFTGQYARHRRMARWVYPLWLYVAITGPICYLFLRPYYP
jgi:putative membrane protein